MQCTSLTFQHFSKNKKVFFPTASLEKNKLNGFGYVDESRK